MRIFDRQSGCVSTRRARSRCCDKYGIEELRKQAEEECKASGSPNATSPIKKKKKKKKVAPLFADDERESSRPRRRIATAAQR